MNTPPPAAPAAAPASPGSSAKTWIIVALVLAVLGFAVGYFVARGPVGELRLRADAAEERAEIAEEREAIATTRAALIEALALDYRAVLALDARNFGTANDHLQNAAGVLAEVDTSLVDTDGLAALRRQMEDTDINVALDLGQQRTTLLGFARALEGFVPERPAAAPRDTTAAP